MTIETPRPYMNAYVNWSGCMHGIDPAGVEFHRDEINDALFIYLDRRHEMSIRIDLKDGPDALNRDREGLRRLAEFAAQADAEIGQRQEGSTS